MKTPVYGAHQGQPVDVFKTLQASYQFNLVLGQITVDGSSGAAFQLASRRSGLTFSAISGLDVVISEEQDYETVAFEDGTRRKYDLVTLYAAVFTGGDIAALRGSLRGLGYVSQAESILTEAAYATAVGGTGDYSAGTSFHRIVIRAGVGRKVAFEPLQYSEAPEVSQDGAAGEGGYEFTGGFADRTTGLAGVSTDGSNVLYTQDMVDNDRWMRFGFDTAQQQANDAAYWSNPAPSPTEGVGLFGGSYMPKGVDSLFDFGFSDSSYNDAVEAGDFQYTAAQGSLDFSQCRPGDLALVRFDFNVRPQIANTTLEVALIWQTRDEAGNPTFTFALTGDPTFFGTGSTGRTFLSRPILSAYFASNEDVNARALLAIRADNPIQIQPLTTLVTIQR